jgi:hypothetical protein
MIPVLTYANGDCFVAEPVLGRRIAPTRGLLAMTTTYLCHCEQSEAISAGDESVRWSGSHHWICLSKRGCVALAGLLVASPAAPAADVHRSWPGRHLRGRAADHPASAR